MSIPNYNSLILSGYFVIKKRSYLRVIGDNSSLRLSRLGLRGNVLLADKTSFFSGEIMYPWRLTHHPGTRK